MSVMSACAGLGILPGMAGIAEEAAGVVARLHPRSRGPFSGLAMRLEQEASQIDRPFVRARRHPVMGNEDRRQVVLVDTQ